MVVIINIKWARQTTKGVVIITLKGQSINIKGLLTLPPKRTLELWWEKERKQEARNTSKNFVSNATMLHLVYLMFLSYLLREGLDYSGRWSESDE